MNDCPNDSDLLKRYLSEGAENAFSDLVQRHLTLVYGAAFRHLQDSGLAQEVAQSVFITLAKRAVWLTGHPSLAGWLYRTAVHLAQHASRNEQRRRKREEVAVELGTCMKMDESLLSSIAPILDEAMLELRASDREALLLRFFANKSLRDVGTALGVREDAAQKRVAKALESLAERFRRRGFRVVGASVLALALQQAGAHAVPAGLGLSTTQAALSAAAAASLGSLTVPIIKIMSLTKLQTAALCLCVAAVPLGYQWHALTQTRTAGYQLTEQLRGLRTDALFRESGRTQTERQLSALQVQLAQLGTNESVFRTGTPGAQGKLYPWDEASPYVRVPKGILSQVRFGPFASRVGRDGRPERYQLPPLKADGSPQPALEAALGLSTEEAARLRAVCQSSFTAFEEIAASHSQLKEEPFAGTTPAVKLSTEAFPEEGGQLRDQFKARVSELLGPERAEAFWQQASPVFADLFNDFGAYPRDLQLINNPQQGPELMNAYRGSTRIGSLADRNGMPLPPALQNYAEAWIQARANQTLPQSQPQL